MNLSDIINEANLGGETKRVKELFIKTFKATLKSRSRDIKLDYIMDILEEVLSKSDMRFLTLRLQRKIQNK